MDGLFSQLLQPSHEKVALIGSGCSAVSDATAEISYHYNLTHVIITIGKLRVVAVCAM